MNNIKYNYHSWRSEKARISVRFNKPFVIFLIGLMLILLASGLYCLTIGLSVSWFLIGLSFVPAMAIEWYNGELHHMLPTRNPSSIDDVLSADLLGRLSKKPNPLEIAELVGLVSGGHFMATRFGIGNGFLKELSSNNVDDMEEVWQEAWQIYKDTESRNMSAAVLILALIKTSKNGEKLLSHLQLDTSDLVNGIKWHNHLRYLIDQSRINRINGGIARDWSFGWTPLLDKFGQNISKRLKKYDATLDHLASHEEVVEQISEIFNNDSRQNVALVGQSGVGKTQIIHAFASYLLNGSIAKSKTRYNQVFILDASTLIATAPGRGEIEQLLPKIINEAYKAKNIILCLDNAELFFEDGTGSVDVSNILLPIVEDGRMRIIFTFEEQKFLQISQKAPVLTSNLNRIAVASSSRDQTIAVMQDQAVTLEYQNHVTIMYQALTECYRLGERYIFDVGMPGKALRLLEAATHYSDNGLVSANSVRQAIEKTIGVKIGVANSQEEKDMLLNLEDLIHKRMINQSRAVKVISDALRRARTGVRNQNRPIGTFLFLGPTGVGKTELSKALAEVYFGDIKNLIRLDMNEYSGDDDGRRLIADGSKNANSLTARVMKRPFSVVLLDEIEKASDNVLNTLLQMLDEGVLRDENNREVSFRDAIIIATSNAGADRIREYIDRGYDLEQFEEKLNSELIESGQFRVEFLNRFDEIVMFRPLNKKELIMVVDLILSGINKTLELQKISVELDENAKQYLVDVGYDPKLGARPMRRIIQRAVENLVAEQMLKDSVVSGTVMRVSLSQVKRMLDAHDHADKLASSNH